MIFRLLILDWQVMHHIAHSQFHNLAALGARNIDDLHDFCGHMARRRVVANRRLDTLLQSVGQLQSLAQFDK